HDSARHPDDSEEVRIEDRSRLFDGALFRSGGGDTEAGVVHEHVDAAAQPDHVLHDGLDGFIAGHVERQHLERSPARLGSPSARALMRSLALFSNVGERRAADPLSAIAAAYLTSRHRDNPGEGCLLAALGSDVSRQGPTVRRAVTGHLRSAVDLLATLVPGKSKTARRQKAISTYATLVGTMVLARAVDNRALSQEILDAGLASVKG